MARGILARLLAAHTITVEPFTGTNGKGQKTYGPPVQVQGYFDASSSMVRNADGEEVRSGATFYTAPGNTALFPLDARVTAPGDLSVAHPDGTTTSTSTVIKVNAFDTGGVVARLEHVAVNLI